MKYRRSTRYGWDRTVLNTSCAIILMAVLVLLGWFAHIRAAVQIIEGLVPMRCGAALCFLMLGAAGLGLSSRRRPLMLVGGVLVALMGAVVILEYATGISLGVDTLFFSQWERTLSSDSVRMGLTTAIGFFLAGGALAVLAIRPRAYAVLGIVTSVPLSLALTSLIAYTFQLTSQIPFGLGSHMSLHTSAAFLAHGIAMMGYAWKYAERGPDGAPKWGAGIGVALLPVLLMAASALFPAQSWRFVALETLLSILGVALITLAVQRLATAKVAYKVMLMTAVPLILILVFVGLVIHVKHRSEEDQAWTLNSKEVLGAAQSLLARLVEAESAVRGYMVTRDETFVDSYKNSLESVARGSMRLRALVNDNPVQVASVQNIEELIAKNLTFFSSVIRVIKSGDRKEIDEIIESKSGVYLMDQARTEMGAFLQEEKRLDGERRQDTDRSSEQLSLLLMSGAAAAILLASILTLLFSGGISRRLGQLRNNANNLATGQNLAPPLSGNDEIAELDRIFHEMALTLGEMTRREKAVIEGTTDGIFVKDLNHRYLMINQAGAAHLGKTVKEIIGASVHDLLSPESAARIVKQDDGVAAGGETMTFELTIMTRAGVERTYLTTKGPYRDGRGDVVGTIGVNRDITERKRAEAERQAIAEIVQGVIATASLDELFDLVHVSISKLLSAENCYVALYDRASDILHIPFCKDEFDSIAEPQKLGRGLTAFVLRAGRPMLLTTDLIQGLASKGEIDLVGTLPAAWLGVPLRTSTDVTGVLVVQHYQNKEAYGQQDLKLLAEVGDQLGLAVQRKQIEIELKTNEMQLTAAQQVAHIGSWEWDLIKRKLHWSAELFRIFELAPRASGPTFKEFFACVHPSDLELVQGAIERAVQQGVLGSFDFRILHSDGAIRVLHINGDAVGDDAGRITRLWGTIQDITERKREEKERDVISEVIHSVNLAPNLDELLKLVHQSLKRVLYAENCCVALYDRRTGLFEAALFVDLIEANPFPIPLTRNCIGKVFTSRQPLLMNEAIFDDLLERGEVDSIGRPAPSFLAVPLMTPAETIGVIVVQHYEEDNVYSQRDVEFLTAVASQLALSIERKRAEEALIESERRYRDLFFDAPVGYHEIDIDGRITCVNTTELSMLGYSSEEMTGHYVWEFIEEADNARETFAEKITRTTPLGSIERSFRRKDGSYIAVELDDQMLEDSSGRVTGIRATMRDIVERKRTEEALIQSEQRFRDLFENASDVIYTADFSGNFTSLNRSGERMTGYSREEALHLNFSDVVSPETLEVIREMTRRKLESYDETVYEVEFFKKGGEPSLVEVSSRAIYKDGKPVGIQGMGRDITQRKQVEADLKLARDAALESVRLKSEFLANMSHEIRTPMNGVIGMTGLLLDTDLTPEQEDYAETINSSAAALLMIIDDILDFSKIEAGLLRFEKIDFEIRAAVEASVEVLAERAQSKGLELASLVYSDVPAGVRGDPGRLRQVLTNLIGNAVKFTGHGEVVVTVTKVRETATVATLRFEIRDTGIGIPVVAQAGIFRAFIQADGSTTRKYGGTGLGLAISKQLVELMGGQIGIESTPDHGATFWFTAEFETHDKAAASVGETSGGLFRARVLIVDDNATARRILNHQTSSWGMIATEAASAEKALELLRGGAKNGKPYDIVILDLVMPETDGFQLADAITADPSIAGVVLVLLGSYGKRGRDGQMRQAGIAAYLQKPVRESQLNDCLTEVLARSTANQSVTPASLVQPTSIREAKSPKVRKPISRARIMIAEDNLVNQKVAQGQLRKLGYDADLALNGEELLRTLETQQFDLILMDCQMPDIDGFAATIEIRRREGATRHTPIIAMTANAVKGDKAKCLAAGMDGYLSKPVEAAALRQELERWILPEELDVVE